MPDRLLTDRSRDRQGAVNGWHLSLVTQRDHRVDAGGFARGHVTG
ncbi:hypothetical protein SBA4_1650003 [Candidatus Sulfopaludibacter sp. SbA4]|nr:hypothetical protein SBA4_1650003 [Candidatus Sulfopaludibacter sp. SbA4]